MTLHYVERHRETPHAETGDAHLAWYEEHGREGEAQWRRDGIASMRERIYAVESHSRWPAAAVFTGRFFHAMHRAERHPFCNEVLGNPRLTRRGMRRLLEQRCAQIRMSARQMLRLRRESQRARQESEPTPPEP